MSGRGFIAEEPPQRCDLCGEIAELRPYGPKGEKVCFDCGQKDQRAARRGFARHVLGWIGTDEEIDRNLDDIEQGGPP